MSDYLHLAEEAEQRQRKLKGPRWVKSDVVDLASAIRELHEKNEGLEEESGRWERLYHGEEENDAFLNLQINDLESTVARLQAENERKDEALEHLENELHGMLSWQGLHFERKVFINQLAGVARSALSPTEKG